MKLSGSLEASAPIGARPRHTGVVHYFAVQARKTLWTVAQKTVGSRVLAGTSILAWLVGATVVQILITEYATPIRFTDALPRYFFAVAMFAAGIRLTFVTKLPSPPSPAFAFSRLTAMSMLRVAASPANRCLTVVALPAVNALLVAVGAALVVAEVVVARPTERLTGGVVVVGGALHAHAVRDASHLALVIQCVPLRRRQDDARVRRLLDQHVAF